MPKLIVIKQSGAEVEIAGQADHSLMDVIRNDGGVEDLLALCGGSCACATCHIWVDPAFIDKLPAASANENNLLAGTGHRQDNSRLSCQLKFTDELDGLRVTLAPID